MIKRVVMVIVLIVAITFAGSQNNQAQAYDKYVGKYPSGYSAYLMTETLSGSAFAFKCTVKAKYGSDVIYVYYEFWQGRSMYFKNSQGYLDSVYNNNPVELKIFEYAQQVLPD